MEGVDFAIHSDGQTLVVTGQQENLDDISYAGLHKRAEARNFESGFMLPHWPGVRNQHEQFAVWPRQELNKMTLSDAHMQRLVAPDRTNGPLNRYSDVLPCTLYAARHSLVPLRAPPHYINANFIHVASR